MNLLYSTTSYVTNSIRALSQQGQNISRTDSSLNRAQTEISLPNAQADENVFGIFELKNAIPQYGNSCWLSSCLNMLAMIPDFTTNDKRINILLERIRGCNNLSYREIISRISTILEEFGKSRYQFETSDGMEILNLIKMYNDVTIMVHEIPDEFRMSKFLVIPSGVIGSFDCGFQDIISMKGSKSIHDYQPVAWIIRRGNLHVGHCTLIYQSDCGELFEIDTISQTITELKDFPSLTETDTIQYILYAKLV